MPPSAPVSASINARVIHGALVSGILLFGAIAWSLGRSEPVPADALPDRRVLYISLFVVSAVLFGAAMFTANRLTHLGAGASQDEWWRANLGKAVTIWALVEAPTLLGLVAYTLTHDFRVLIATLTGLLLFGNLRPSRLIER